MFARALKVLVNAVALAAAALARPTPAHAQLNIEIAPAFGAYVLQNGLPNPRIVVCYNKSSGPCRASVSYKQTPAVALGGRITASPWNRGSTRGWAAIDGTLWYTPSRVGTDGSQGLNQAGNIVLASARFVVRLAPQARISALLTGGPAVIHRFGEFYSGAQGTTSTGGTFGVGLDVHPGRRFGLRAEISAYLYNLQFHHQLTPDQQILLQQGSLYASSGMMQNDFVFSLSISPCGTFQRRWSE